MSNLLFVKERISSTGGMFRRIVSNMKMIQNAGMCMIAMAMGMSAIRAADEVWMEDFEAAKAKAAKENKSLLIDFTGSDWCGWCIKLDKEVFDHDAFRNGVKDTFVLVKLDYPNDTSKMSEKIIAQNEVLKNEYEITQYPTIMLTDEKGSPFARTGYQAGGPEKYLESLKELLGKRAERDAALEAAGKLEGLEKAKAFTEVLKSLEMSEAALAKFYSTELDEIRKADPADSSGFIKEIDGAVKFAAFESQLEKLDEAEDYKGMLELVEKTLAESGFEGAMKQQLLTVKGMILAQTGDFEKSLATLDEAKAADPDGPMAARFDILKQRVEAMKKLAENRAAQAKEAAEGEEAGEKTREAE